MNLIFHKHQLLMLKSGDSYELPDTEHLAKISYINSLIKVEGVSILGTISKDSDVLVDSELELIGLRQALSLISHINLEKFIYAQQVLHFQNTHRFCGSCGSKTIASKTGHWLVCSACQEEIYPRISPAMILMVCRGDEILMAQGHHFASHVWGLVAGYSEIGESLEQTVAREVMEEVGLEIKNIKYWGSQYWPFPNSLMVGFIADYESGEIKIDPVEIKNAGFFNRENLPGLPSTNLSIASKMIEEWVNKY